MISTIVSRYLHQQWDKKANSVKKRAGEASGGEGGEASKKPRLETLPDTSNTQAGASARAPSFSHGPGNSSGPPPAYPGTSHQDNRFANQQ